MAEPSIDTADSMELSPSEDNIRSGNEEIRRLLWNPRVHYFVHNSGPLKSISVIYINARKIKT